MRTFRWDKPPLDQPDPEPELTTPDEIREAITNLAHTASRMPAHWVERRATIHARIDELLTPLEASG